MAYVKQSWSNSPNTASPISADRLNHLETQYEEAVAASVPRTVQPGRVYTTGPGGSQTTKILTPGTVSDAVVQRDGQHVRVPLSPTSPDHAASKDYVDTRQGGGGVSGPEADDKVIRGVIGTPVGESGFERIRDTLLGESSRCVVVVVGSSTFAGNLAPYIGGIERLAWRSGAAGIQSLSSLTSRPGNTAGMVWRSGATGGARSSDYLPEDRLVKIALADPDYVLHGVGSNDWKDQVSLTAYKANVRAGCVQIENDTPGVVNVLVHQQARPDQGELPIPWEAYGQALREVAEEVPGRVFIDVNAMLDTYRLERAGNRFGFIGDDNLHMSHEGHKVFADVLGMVMGIPREQATPMFYSAQFPTSANYNTTTTLASIPLGARSYPRMVEVRAAMFYRGDITGNADLAIGLTEEFQHRERLTSGSENKHAEIGKKFYLPPGQSATARASLVLSSNPSVYVSGGTQFSYLQVEEQAF